MFRSGHYPVPCQLFWQVFLGYQWAQLELGKLCTCLKDAEENEVSPVESKEPAVACPTDVTAQASQKSYGVIEDLTYVVVSNRPVIAC